VVHEHEGLQQSQYRVANPLLPVMGGFVLPGEALPPTLLDPPALPFDPPALPFAPPLLFEPPAPPRAPAPPALAAPPALLGLVPEQRPQLLSQYVLNQSAEHVFQAAQSGQVGVWFGGGVSVQLPEV
jgi:hypothetical protein